MGLIDLHCDTIMLLMDQENVGLRQNDLSIDSEKLKGAESLAQFFALYVDMGKYSKPFEEGLRMADRFYQELDKNKDLIAWAGNGAEIRQNQLEGKISAMLSIEEGGVLAGKLEHLRTFYRLGVRMITLTWNYPNEIGFPHGQEHGEKGLTPFGLKIIEEMNRLGMLVDVSHLSEGGFWDVVKHSKAPSMASHSNCRTLREHTRNLTDEQIRTLSDRGGVMGISVVASFLNDPTLNSNRIDDMVRHINHAYQIGGLDVIAIGTDFDGTVAGKELSRIDEMYRLADALKKAGYKEDAIEKIWWKNALRVIDEVL